MNQAEQNHWSEKENYMKKNIGEILSIFFVTFGAAFTLLLAGCGDSEMAKGITDAVKKSVEGEVNKTGEEIKKQIDQVLNLGSGKDQEDNGKNAGGSGEEESSEGSQEGND